jgi:hypothetical protein
MLCAFAHAGNDSPDFFAVSNRRLLSPPNCKDPVGRTSVRISRLCRPLSQIKEVTRTEHYHLGLVCFGLLHAVQHPDVTFK